MTRLDAWLPAYEFSEHHERVVRAPARVVHRTLHELDVARIPVLRALMALRALPAIARSPRAALARLHAPSPPRALGLMAVRGGALLCDEPLEIVLGLTGRFWRASGEILPTDAATFRDAPPAGAARVAMSFLLTPRGDGATLVSTDTRIHCADEASRRAFAWYWRAIRLGSGAIRLAMLSALKRAAESAAASESNAS